MAKRILMFQSWLYYDGLFISIYLKAELINNLFVPQTAYRVEVSDRFNRVQPFKLKNDLAQAYIKKDIPVINLPRLKSFTYAGNVLMPGFIFLDGAVIFETSAWDICSVWELHGEKIREFPVGVNERVVPGIKNLIADWNNRS